MTGARRISWLATAVLALGAADAHAIPAFARKYGTSCATCHTVYPRLNGFGESFRRRGYRFPGVDSDAVKQEPIALGQERDAARFPEATWPGTLPAGLPLAFSMNGQAVAHPDVRSGGAQTDHGAVFSLKDLVGEGHLWAGGSLDDHLTFFAQVTFSTAPSIDVENAELHFNDLVGPPGTLNLVVGRGSPSLTSFGPHSSYLVDTLLPSLAVAGLYGATTPSFALTAHVTGVELNGVALGRLCWSVGLNAGTNLDLRPTENVHAHAGLTVGGRELLDGSPAPDGPTFTLDVYGERARSRFGVTGGGEASDVALVLGGALRVAWGRVTLDVGASAEQHDHAQAGVATPGAEGVAAMTQHDELSWVALPWLVPALRVEYVRVWPQGDAMAWDLRVVPGVAALVRQNVKVVLLASFETATGAPPAGWDRAGGAARPASPRAPVPLENESVQLRLDTAF